MQKNLSRGFTLIELFIVMTIIFILASLAYPVYTTTQERARATQDMSNLRQIGLAAQMYFNDNDGVIFSSDAAAGSWMAQLKPKYIPAWKIFQSPFDRRAASEDPSAAPISYGINGNTNIGASGIVGTPGEKVTNPSAFILFAPTQTSAASVTFSGTAGQTAPGVKVWKDASTPGGTATGGTHSVRKRINALFLDSHSETMTWTLFKNDTASSTDPDANKRWDL
jgi:prepilin-type N-terminal cleavage/methylation domain-containing protein